jgi:hypothetical protein
MNFKKILIRFILINSLGFGLIIMTLMTLSPVVADSEQPLSSSEECATVVCQDDVDDLKDDTQIRSTATSIPSYTDAYAAPAQSQLRSTATSIPSYTDAYIAPSQPQIISTATIIPSYTDAYNPDGN